MEEYLLTIYVFVYLCVKFKFRYLRSNTHISVLIIRTLHFYFCLHSSFLRKINSLYYLRTFFKLKAFQIDLCGFYRFMAQ